MIDVDSHNFPNVALMKIAAYEKSLGNHVEWWNGFKHYDTVYKAKVFDSTYSEDEMTCINADSIITGGTGYAGDGPLADNIEHMYPDYSLYGIEDTAYGFITRGCPRHCDFCIVGDKEGLVSHKVADLSEFWQGQKNIILLDPNITASKECEQIFDELIKTKAKIEFNQGLDIRCLTDKGADQLSRMKLKMLHFAWDNYEFKTYEKLKYFRPLLQKRGRELRVYVLTNFNTNHEQDLERIIKLRELDYDPFVMVYDRPNAPAVTKKLQRWCNNKFVFRATDWENYQYK